MAAERPRRVRGRAAGVGLDGPSVTTDISMKRAWRRVGLPLPLPLPTALLVCAALRYAACNVAMDVSVTPNLPPLETNPPVCLLQVLCLLG